MPTQRGRRAFAYASFLTVAWVILWGVSLRRLPASEFLWLTLLYLCCSLPTVLFVAGHPFRIPLMPMWGLGYFFMFAMPMLSQDVQMGLDYFVPEAIVVNAVRLATLGAGMCLLGFYTPFGRWVERLVPQIKAPWDLHRAPTLGVSLVLVGLGIHYYRLTSSVPAWLAQLVFIGSQLAMVGILTLFLLQLRGRLSLRLKLFLWGAAFPINLLLALGTGQVFNAIVVTAPLLFCYAAERGRIPWQALVAGALCVVPFSGFKTDFRAAAWYGELGEINITSSPIQRGLAFMGLVGKRLGEGGLEAYTGATELAQARVSHLGVFIAIMEMTPSPVPFWHGESYRSFFWLFVPRFLFPNKPEKTLGQEFGHRYGLLNEEDLDTSFNFPHQVVEMYANFGALGVVFGMLIVGWIYRAILTLLSHPEAGERSLIIGCALLANLLSLDSDFSLVFGGVAYYVFAMYFFVRFLRPPSPLQTQAAPGSG